MDGRQGDQVKVPSEGRGKKVGGGWGTTLISQQGANTISINYCIYATRVWVYTVQLQNKQHTTEEKPDIPHTEMSYKITKQEAMAYM
jgi:hypothetical protein